MDYSALKATEQAPIQKSKPAKRPVTKIHDNLPTSKENEIEAFVHWMKQKRYAANTIKIYHSYLTTFFGYYHEKPIAEIGPTEIERFNYDYILKSGYASKTQNQYISAIKTYFLKMKKVRQEIENLERPRTEKKLPMVIPIEKIQEMLAGVSNIKHKTALSTVYSLGLRRGELLNLKLNSISFKRNVVEIRNAKGKKDRDLPLPASLRELIKQYYRQKKPQVWLIEGQKAGRPYSATSLENIFKDNLEKVIKNHSFTLHSLRHSYATHLMDMGVDLRVIQELLGHKSSKTTEIYTHVSMRKLKDVRNPLDDFKL